MISFSTYIMVWHNILLFAFINSIIIIHDRANVLETCYQEALLYLKYAISSYDFCYKLVASMTAKIGDQVSLFIHNLDSFL
jgi:hypothetical protein